MSLNIANLFLAMYLYLPCYSDANINQFVFVFAVVPHMFNDVFFFYFLFLLL